YGVQPAGRAPALRGGVQREADHVLDRWSLLIELLDACRDVRMARILAKSQSVTIDEHARYHLGPFTAPADTLAALRHFRRLGLHSARIDAFATVLEDLAQMRDDAKPR